MLDEFDWMNFHHKIAEFKQLNTDADRISQAQKFRLFYHMT